MKKFILSTIILSLLSLMGYSQLTINVQPIPTAPTIAASPTAINYGESSTLTASGCTGTITWTAGTTGTGATKTVSPIVTTTYSATCTVNGCTSPAGSVQVSVSANPVTISASPTVICNGESSTLTASGCTGTITWNTGETTASISVSPSSTTTYSVTCTEGTLTSTANQIVTVNPIPTAPTIAASPTAINYGESSTLTASGCTGTITWTAGTTGTGATKTVSPIVTTTYSATCTVNGCTSPAGSVQVSVSANPVTVSANATDVCQGTDVVLTASGCTGTYNWSTGETTASITVGTTNIENYWVECIEGTLTSPRYTITLTEL